METGLFDEKDTLIQMVLVIKLQQLQREYLPTLTYQQLEKYAAECIFGKKRISALYIATDQILGIQAKDVVQFLSKKAIIEGGKQSLSDFSDVIGGK